MYTGLCTLVYERASIYLGHVYGNNTFQRSSVYFFRFIGLIKP